MIKMCTSTTSHKMGNSSSYWARNLFIDYLVILNDSWYKVYAVFLLETLQTALSGADLYYWFVSGFGDMDHLHSPYLSPFDVPIIGSAISLTVQFFFAYRVWVLSAKKSWWLCVIICIVSWLHNFDLNPITYCLR
jgi:hypothetical protein